MRKIPTTIKFPAEMRRVIVEAARKRGVNLSEFVRDAAFELAVKTTGACVHCGQPHQKVA